MNLAPDCLHINGKRVIIELDPPPIPFRGFDKWHKGPPPSVGWWPASMNRVSSVYRWWDGAGWSLACMQHASADTVLAISQTRASKRPLIEWADRPAWWPERSKT